MSLRVTMEALFLFHAVVACFLRSSDRDPFTALHLSKSASLASPFACGLSLLGLLLASNMSQPVRVRMCDRTVSTTVSYVSKLLSFNAKCTAMVSIPAITVAAKKYCGIRLPLWSSWAPTGLSKLSGDSQIVLSRRTLRIALHIAWNLLLCRGSYTDTTTSKLHHVSPGCFVSMALSLTCTWCCSAHLLVTWFTGQPERTCCRLRKLHQPSSSMQTALAYALTRLPTSVCPRA